MTKDERLRLKREIWQEFKTELLAFCDDRARSAQTNASVGDCSAKERHQAQGAAREVEAFRYAIRGFRVTA